MNLTIAIPALNEEQTLRATIESLPRAIPGIERIQVLVVDDGSTDATAAVARAAGAGVISHPVNRGVGVAFQTAVEAAIVGGTDLLVTVDADGQFDVAQIPDLIAPILSGQADAVTGNRFTSGKPDNMPRSKYWGNRVIAGVVSSAARTRLQDVSCGFRAYGQEALLRLNLFGGFTYTQEVLLSLLFKNLRVVEVPIRVTYFPERQSRVASSLLRYARQTSKILFRTVIDYRALAVLGGAGGSLVGLGTLLVLGLLIYFLVTGSFTPYKFVGFTGLGLAVIGGLLILVGIVADMLTRVRLTQERILYEQRRQRLASAPPPAGDPQN